MKIGIITFYMDQKNFGQKLQNYALQKILKKLGHNPVTFQLSWLQWFDKNDPNKIFEYDHINTHWVYDLNQINDSSYDCYIIGSDQVLNCDYLKKTYLMYDFISCKNIENKNKIFTYAMSDGHNNLNILDSDEKENFFHEIMKIKNFSFREYDSYLKYKNGNNNFNYHIDPALLLNKDEWTSIEKKPSFIQDTEIYNVFYEPYNSGNPSSNYNIDKNIKIYNLYALNIGPAEFLWLINHCNIVYTNSYHATIFSLIFNKKIKILNINDFRIKNLFNILNVKYDGLNILNYQNIYQKIQLEHSRSIKYILNCIEEVSKLNVEMCCYSNNTVIRNNSTSGGFCNIASDYIFKQNGCVYGARYSDDYKSVYTDCVYNIEDYNNYISKSKYSYCKLTKFSKIKEKLNSGILVLYIGLPCHVKALLKYLDKEYSNLYTIELLCSGVSHNKILKNYIEALEKKFNSRVCNLDMRYNHKSICKIKFENNTEFIDNINTYDFFIDSCRMEQCKKCHLHMGSRCADITVGDFWDHYNKNRVNNLDFKPYNGTNYLIVNTHKGLNFFKQIKNKLNSIIL